MAADGRAGQVKVHDFLDPTLGKANAVRGLRRGGEHGWVSVGTDHDTAAFAVNTIATWWRNAGKTYPNASRLLICADGAAPTATAPGNGRPSSPSSPPPPA